MRKVKAVAMVLILAAAASADTVTFKDGGGLEGKLVRETATHLTFEVVVGGKPVKVTVPIDRIATHVRSATRAEQYGKRLKAAKPDDPEAQVVLAAWCLEQGMKEEAGDHLRQAVQTDPRHARAVALLEQLGYVRLGEVWMSGEEYSAYLEGGVKRDPGSDAAPEVSPSVADKETQLLKGVTWHLSRAEVRVGQAKSAVEEARRNLAKDQERLGPLFTQQAEASRRVAQGRLTVTVTNGTEYVTRHRNPAAERELSSLQARIRSQQMACQLRQEELEKAEALLRRHQDELVRLQNRKAELERAIASKPKPPAPAEPTPTYTPPPVPPATLPPAPVAPPPAAPAPVPSEARPVPAAP